MKRLLLLVIALMGIIRIYAQTDSERFARQAFISGNYGDAVELYKAAIALTRDTDKTKSLTSALAIAQKCQNLLKVGQQQFAAKKYESAKKTYEEILEYNSDDNFARSRIAALKKQIALAAYRRDIEKAYNSAMASASIDELENFLKKYPSHEKAEFIKDLVGFLKKKSPMPDDSEIPFYLSAGQELQRCNNITLARKLFDMAASLGNAEGLYRKALTIKDWALVEARSLFVMAYTGGYSKANEIVDGFIWNQDTAKERYRYLCNYRTNLQSLVYLYENKENYYLDNLNLEYYIVHHPILQGSDSKHYDDNLIFQFAKIAKSIGANPQKAMKLAASKGNVDAVKWLYDATSASMSDEEKRAYKRYFENYNETSGYHDYINYLKGEKLTSFDWNSVKYYTDDRHEKLLSYAFGAGIFRSDFKGFKQLLHSHSVWDKDIIDRIRKEAAYYAPKYSKRVIRQVSKVITSQGLYDITAGPTYKLVQSGYLNSPHRYVPQIGKHAPLISLKPSSTKSTKTAKDTKPSQTVSQRQTTTKSEESIDEKIIKYIRQNGGILAFTSSGTAISKDGSTTFIVRVMDNSHISIAVNGTTGNKVSFSNSALKMTLKDGYATATNSDLKTCRYSSFRASFSISGNKLKFCASYTTASYASFSIEKTIYLKNI